MKCLALLIVCTMIPGRVTLIIDYKCSIGSMLDIFCFDIRLPDPALSYRVAIQDLTFDMKENVC